MSIFTKRPWSPKMMLDKPSSPFYIPWLDNIKINYYSNFDPNTPCGSRVMLATTGWTDAHQTLVHQIGGYANHWLGNIDMHMYAKCDQNIPRFMNFFTNCLWADEHTHIVIIVQTQWSCNILNTVAKTGEKVLRLK